MSSGRAVFTIECHGAPCLHSSSQLFYPSVGCAGRLDAMAHDTDAPTTHKMPPEQWARQPEVQQLLAELQMQSVTIKGCAAGLQSVVVFAVLTFCVALTVVQNRALPSHPSSPSIIPV